MSSAPAHPANEPDTVFRDPAFRHFWFTRLCTTIGYQIFTVAVGWQMYDLTRDPFMLGMVGLVQFLPSIVLMLMSLLTTSLLLLLLPALSRFCMLAWRK